MRTRRAVAPLLALALLAGCAGARDESAEEAPPPPPELAAAARARLADVAAGRPAARPGRTPAGFRRRTSARDRFSIALPRGWHALRPNDARAPGVAQTLGLARPSLRPYLAGLAMADSPLKMLAFAPGAAEPSTTLTVLVVPAGGAPYERWSGAVVRQVEGLRSLYGRVRVRHARIAAGRALRLDYERRYGGAAHRVTTMQLVVAGGDRLFTLTLATRPEHARVYLRLFAAAADSLTIEP